jgi:putative FmdB family regulatory protein
MPLYEYLCDACGHRFESIQKFSDPPLDRCPKCGGGVRKQQSAPAFQFKGSGWYITDYARKDASGKDDKKYASGGKEKKDTSETKDTKDANEPAVKGETSAANTPSASAAPASPAKPDNR